MLGPSDYLRRHDAEPKAALEALVHHDGPLLLDLDETAYQRNSTDCPRRWRLAPHVIARRVPYYIYRTCRKRWPETPCFLMRLLFYSLLWIILAITTQNFAALLTTTALLLLLWNLFRARKELRQMLGGIHRIDREEPSST